MKEVLVETSARHIHLSREAVDILFGEGYELTNKKDLSQPGQFACAEKLMIVGPKGQLKASILGPTRNASQVEITFLAICFAVIFLPLAVPVEPLPEPLPLCGFSPDS